MMDVPVYAAGGTYHHDVECTVLRREAQDAGVGWCHASQAHRSCLVPCRGCAGDLARTLTTQIGSIPSGARRQLPRPVLAPLRDVRSAKGSSTSHTSARAGDISVAVPYGAPGDADDVRFSAFSAAGWGVGAFGQHHDEFLGENTDDDHDWRGAGRYMD